VNSFDKTINKQREICKNYGAIFCLSDVNSIVGISLNVKDAKILPINGLRYHPEGKTNGWYIWVGSEPLSKDDDYFKPLHIKHLFEWCPEVISYLGLPPGWRFLLAPDYVDVWFDQNIFDMT